MRNQIIGIFATVIILVSSCESPSETSNTATPAQGEIAQGFQANENNLPVIEQQPPVLTAEEKLFEEGWEHQTISNGIMPNCYNYQPGYGELENELAVSVGKGTDVVIKLMSLSTGRCVRYVFINRGNIYRIKKIPEGRYYLKIAYGLSWISKLEAGRCMGRFLHNSLYEQGEDTLDFNRKTTINGYSIPSYNLRLEVISESTENAFNASGISEGEFNN